MICVSRAPLDRLLAYRDRMGWNFTWASSHDSDFNADFGVSALEQMTQDTAAPRPEANELAAEAVQPPAVCGRGCRWSRRRSTTRDRPRGLLLRGTRPDTFAREDGTVYHCYSSYSGTEFLMGYYAILDRAPHGRGAISR